MLFVHPHHLRRACPGPHSPVAMGVIAVCAGVGLDIDVWRRSTRAKSSFSMPTPNQGGEKGLCFQPDPALSGGGLEQELCLSGEVTTSTALGPSAEDRVTHPSTANALSLPHQEPLPHMG